MLFRIGQIVILLLAGLAMLQDMWWLVVFLGLVHTYYYGALWLVFLAIGVDAYFGAFSNVPVLSISLLLWFIISELLRLRLRIV